MEWLFVLFVVLAGVTVLGHGIWVVVAMVLRALFVGDRPRPAAPTTICSQCGHLTGTASPVCTWCGRPWRDAKAMELADLEAVERQLARFQTQGALTPRTARRWLARIEAYRRGLAAKPAAAQAPDVVVQQLVAEQAAGEIVLAEIAESAEPAIKETTAAAGSAAAKELVAAVATAAESVARRQEIATSRPAAPLPPTPRRSLAEVFSTFMEERNIRWGELVGGLLIVCSSVALVISLWETLKTIPYFQFFIFVSVTAALFGVGLYTEHRWKLASTSRGVLLIATLLVPLNFAAMVGTARAGWDLPAALTELASLAIFVFLVNQAAKVLVPDWRRWLSLAVVGPSGSLLLVPHEPSLAALAALAALPVACHAASLGRVLWALRRQRLEAGQVNRLFILAGAATFALVVALGLLVIRGADRAAALNWLAPLVALAALPVAGTGLTAMRGLDSAATAEARENVEGLRFAGTATGLVGMGLMLLALGFAWPLPGGLVAVGLVDCAAIAFLALRYRLPVAHVAAIVCLASAYVTLFHLAWGNLDGTPREALGRTLLALATGAQTGTALVGLFALLALAAEALARWGRRGDSAFYAGGCGVTALVSLSLVTAPCLAGRADTLRAMIVYGVYGAGCLALNVRWRRPVLSYIGLGLTSAATLWAGWWFHERGLLPAWSAVTAACLANATLASLAGTWLQLVTRERSETAAPGRLDSLVGLRAAFTEPVWLAAGVNSLGAVAASVWFGWREPRPMSLELFWLAAVWLALAVRERSASTFAAFQAALGSAVGFAVTAWLLAQPWVNHAAELADPRSLQAYGIALGLLSLAWVVVRITLGRNALAEALLNPGAPALDRLLHYALTAGCLALALWGVLPGVALELGPPGSTVASTALHAFAYAAPAWWLVGVLAAGWVIALWDRWRKAELACAWLLFAAGPVLAAGPMLAGTATASAWRWYGAGAFLVGSLFVWFRGPLSAVGRSLKCRIDAGPDGAALSRTLLLAGTVAPVLLLTAAVVVLRLFNGPIVGPAAGTWFKQLGFNLSHIVPLLLVVLGLTGHAVREVSPGYAFAAGTVLNLTVTGGYALVVRRFGATECIVLAQLTAITAAAWAIGWLGCRRKVLELSGQSESPWAHPLLRVQLGLSSGTNAVLLLLSFGLLALFSPHPFEAAHEWIAAAGSPLGWAALGLATAAGGLGGWQMRRRLRPEIVGLVGMAALGLAACTVEAALPSGSPWAYRTLMLSWAMYALSVVAATWWAATALAPAGAALPPALVRTAAIWVRLAGLVSLALGLKAAFWHSGEQLWAAAAIGIASTACAAMAVWQRREGWAFTAGWGVNLAASLVVWHWHLAPELKFADWEILLLQANLIAAAVVALVWLAARKRLYAGRAFSLAAGPLLAVQVGLVLVGNLLLTSMPVVELAIEPGRLSTIAVQQGAYIGWLTWLLAGVLARQYTFEVARGKLLHVLAAFTLGDGALAACSVGAWHGGSWPAYHVLLACWSATGLALLVIALRGTRLRAASLAELWQTNLADWLETLLPRELVEAWISTIEVLVVGLAVRAAWHDPARPYWSAGAILAASSMAGGIAIWLRRPNFVYNSGLLVNLAGSVVWLTDRSRQWIDLASINALCFAVSSAWWTLAGRSLRTPVAGQGATMSGEAAAAKEAEPTLPPFEHVAAVLGVGLVASVVSWGLLTVFAGHAAAIATRLTWLAWGGVVAAILLSLWDPRARYNLAGVYAAGAVGIGLALQQFRLSPRDLAWTAAPVLAGYVLLAALLARLAPQAIWLWKTLRPPMRNEVRSRSWFSPAQGLVAAMALGLSFWIALDFTAVADRLAGGGAAGLLLAAAVLMAGRGDGESRAAWEYAALAFAVVAPAELCWAWLDLKRAAPIVWIHRNVALIGALAAWLGLAQLRLDRLPLAVRRSCEVARRAVPALVAAMLVCLTAVLVQERMNVAWPPAADGLVTSEGVPMAILAKATVAVALAGMIALALAFALDPPRDPWRLSPRGRTAYVYAAELLAILLCFHFRTAMPKLIPIGILEKYWTLVVMIVAFCGAGLSELFSRRRMPVLSEPLIRTAWLAPLLPVVGQLPLVPEWLRRAVMPDVAVYFLVAAFYGLQAATRRSFTFGAISAAAANVGLWALWARYDIEFLRHPQLWLIPPALAVLVAEHLHRGRLSPQQSGAIRYLALAVIYASSTADVFISHVDRHISLPLVLVLMGLSVAGALAGIALRVRSFLYLGVTFLLVDLSIMIYHAAWDLGQIWVACLAGVGVGLAILALFAVFEKRRNDVVQALERFKQWS